jgi:hypothetical protein
VPVLAGLDARGAVDVGLGVGAPAGEGQVLAHEDDRVAAHAQRERELRARHRAAGAQPGVLAEGLEGPLVELAVAGEGEAAARGPPPVLAHAGRADDQGLDRGGVDPGVVPQQVRPGVGHDHEVGRDAVGLEHAQRVRARHHHGAALDAAQQGDVALERRPGRDDEARPLDEGAVERGDRGVRGHLGQRLDALQQPEGPELLARRRLQALRAQRLLDRARDLGVDLLGHPGVGLAPHHDALRQRAAQAEDGVEELDRLPRHLHAPRQAGGGGALRCIEEETLLAGVGEAPDQALRPRAHDDEHVAPRVPTLRKEPAVADHGAGHHTGERRGLPRRRGSIPLARPRARGLTSHG